MKIAVLSGKGGAGKTTVAANLAAVTENAVYADCDVEEPNGRLFLKPEDTEEEEVFSLLPEFDPDKCTGCRKCIEKCRFNALVYLKNKPMVFTEVCHSCGLCSMVCPEGAVKEVKKPVGRIEKGHHKDLEVITGILNLGEASGTGVISAVLKKADNGKDVIIDCPPGSACSVVESIKPADYCIIVAEPTAFGFHNFKMVYELCSVLGKKTGVIINKEDSPYAPLEEFLKEKELDLLARIPYSKKAASLISSGELISEKDEDLRKTFEDIRDKIGGAL